MPILHSPGVITPGQFGPTRRPSGWPFSNVLDAHHVQHRDALGDADDDLDAGVGRFQDRVGGERRRHVDHRRIGAGGGDGLGDGVEHRQAEVGGAALARGDAADDLGAVVSICCAWKVPCEPVKPWTDDLGVLVDQNLPRRFAAQQGRMLQIRPLARVEARRLHFLDASGSQAQFMGGS
jgi:hypothetical protein